MKTTLVLMIKRSIKFSLFYSSNLPLIYKVCKRIVDLHNGEQEIDFTINGEQRFLQERLKQARVVFDVGANVGDWTYLALKANPALQVHCFEPSSTTFGLLQARQFGERAVLNYCGLGDVSGEVTLYVTGKGRDSGCNSLYARPSLTEHRELETETVRIETFDHYCQEAGLTEVDLVKIDTEGYEFQVLKGMQESLQQGRVKAVQFEYGGTYIDARTLLQDVWDYITQLNPRYQFYKLSLGGPKRYTHYKQALENFQYANYAFIRE